MSEHRLLVTGDRNWDDIDFIRRVLLSIHPDVVIEGEAPGADTQAVHAAKDIGIALDPYPAWWSCDEYELDTGLECQLPDGRHQATHGRPAGVLRNQRMLDEGRPTYFVAFHDNLENSRGTRDMVQRAKKQGLSGRHYSHDSPDGVVL